jgi:Lon-like protease
MHRRTTTLVVALGVLVVLVLGASLIKVPYVILRPGPVTDTLGTIPVSENAAHQAGIPVIKISGKPTYDSGGRLYMTTVEELPGNCSSHPSLYSAVKAWFSRTQTVEPQQVQCPPNQTSHQVAQQNAQEMSQSQVDAETAALFELGYKPLTQHVTVGSVNGPPASDVLEDGDVILAINGTPVSTIAELHAVLAKVTAGDVITMTIERNGKVSQVKTKTQTGSGGAAIIGIDADRTATFPGIDVKIGIDPEVIGGPSAGTALALGIIDKLTPSGLTGGRTIAGTGTMDGYGRVGPIGGIQQKIAGAVRAHATIFFAPASECPDAKAAAPKSLTLVKITTLSGAVKALTAIKNGSSDFPRC